MYIHAVSVNHNTSAYMELMARSLYAHHRADIPLALTIYDNESRDDQTELRRYAEQCGIQIQPSGYTTTTRFNSHGTILGRFVSEHPDCSHYLFLDADVCFVQHNTLDTMVTELDHAADTFGIGPRLSWDGEREIPMEIRQANPDICDARLHPCCALVRNTPLFRLLVDEIGLMCFHRLQPNNDEYLDTFKLLTIVMRTHGLRHRISSAMVQHFFCTSYEYDDDATMRYKTNMRDHRLHALRAPPDVGDR